MPNILRLLFLFLLYSVEINGQASPLQIEFDSDHIKVCFNKPGINKQFILETIMPLTTDGAKTELLSFNAESFTTKKLIRYFDNECEIINIVKVSEMLTTLLLPRCFSG
jgi:hypothetical protein